MTLDFAITELYNMLYGSAMTYVPNLDRFRAGTMALNRALRHNALEKEWSYYSSTLQLDVPQPGTTRVILPSTHRLRGVSDDSVRVVNDCGVPILWAYILPRESLHKYRERRGYWCSVTGMELNFSRPLPNIEGLRLELPGMREPRQLLLPRKLESIEQLGAQQQDHWQPTGPPDYNPSEHDPARDYMEIGPDAIESELRNQLIDFEFPDLILAKACHLMAQSDPVMQPRVQTLEEGYKDLMYNLSSRDDAITDSPYQNEFEVPVQHDIFDTGFGWNGRAPRADERY